MKKLLIIFFALCFLSASISSVFAQSKQAIKEEYYRAEVLRVLEEKEKDVSGSKTFFQRLEARILNGGEKGKKVLVERSIPKGLAGQKLNKGETIVVIRQTSESGSLYLFMDRFRLPAIGVILAIFFALVFIMLGRRGIGSMVGMFFGLFVIVKMVVPLILAGYDPLLVSIGGSLLILIVAIYLAHGISKRTTSAVVATFVSLIITGLLSYFFVYFAQLTGLGNEDNYNLQFGPSSINVRGLFLGGIIIGTLGILDDVTTSQAAVVFELYKTDPRLSALALIKKGIAVGREHISSLVNTLVLVYAGVSLSLFIAFVLNPANQPVWVLLNYEMLTEEVVRTIAGSIGLTLAVPIATIIAAYTTTRVKKKS